MLHLICLTFLSNGFYHLMSLPVGTQTKIDTVPVKYLNIPSNSMFEKIDDNYFTNQFILTQQI